jgi:hypothetical protein
MSCNNQQHVITIFYLSVNKLMDRSHKKLVRHMVLMQTVFSAPLLGEVTCTKDRHLKNLTRT